MSTLNDRHRELAGDLALYALGEVDAARCEPFQLHLGECAECRAEYDQLLNDTALLALTTVGPAAPERLRQRVLAAVEGEPRITRMVLFRPRWWALAPVFASAVLAVLAILLWVQNSEIRRQLNTAQQGSATQQRDLERVNEMLACMTSPQTIHATLTASSGPPQPQGRVFYRKDRARLMFFAGNLAPLPANKVYQLWVLPRSGSPVPAGTFAPNPQGAGSVLMPEIPTDIEARSFAVTIEDEGGSQSPTMPIVMAAPPIDSDPAQP